MQAADGGAEGFMARQELLECLGGDDPQRQHYSGSRPSAEELDQSDEAIVLWETYYTATDELFGDTAEALTRIHREREDWRALATLWAAVDYRLFETAELFEHRLNNLEGAAKAYAKALEAGIRTDAAYDALERIYTADYDGLNSRAC